MFYSCARPGRSKGPDAHVHDNIVREWFRNLPGTGETTIISLLGRKHNVAGDSEFKFYSFCGVWDTESERQGKRSFQSWIDEGAFKRAIVLIEHPTFDFKRVPVDTIRAVSADIHRLLEQKQTVVLVDSGGITRTGQICNSEFFLKLR
jgi:hypothetical protein